MDGIYRGGNSRFLAKTLDQSSWPIAVLTGDGEIIYVNAALCKAVEAESTQLVGLRCCWQIPPDGMPFGRLLAALAPPQRVLSSVSAARDIPWPPGQPASTISQLFVPLAENPSGDPSETTWLVLHRSVAAADSAAPQSVHVGSTHAAHPDELLLKLRSQWSHLDGLLPLLGSSIAIQAAMKRMQLAIATAANVFVWGPLGVGKAEVLRAIFSCRLRQHNVPLVSGQMLPLNCGLVDEALLEAMLDVFLARLKSEVPALAQQLTLERIDQLPSPAVAILNKWLDEHESRCCVAASSQVAASTLAERGQSWQKLMGRIEILEAYLPPLSHRREDILVLWQQSLAAACSGANRSPIAVNQPACELLCAYAWPENLAELQRSVAEILPRVVMTQTIQPSHLPLAIRTGSGAALRGSATTVEPIQLDAILEDVERIIIERALKLSPRNRAQAARWLGISRPRLLRRVTELGLDNLTVADEFDAPDGQ